MAARVEAVGRTCCSAHQQAVDGRQSCKKLSVLRRAIALPVVVTAGEVPHQVAEIHIGELIGAVIFKVANKRGVAATPISSTITTALAIILNCKILFFILLVFNCYRSFSTDIKTAWNQSLA